jgi:PII-like signaling protein
MGTPAGQAGSAQPAVLEVSIFIRAGDSYGGRPLYAEIIDRALSAGLEGATAFMGLHGFGASARVHSPGWVRQGPGMPVRIDIAASAARVEAFLPVLDVVMSSGLVTMRPVTCLLHAGGHAVSAGLPPAQPRRVR